MSLEELKKAVSELSPAELRRLHQWMMKFEAANPGRFAPEYISPEAAKAASTLVFEENAELFRKLAE